MLAKGWRRHRPYFEIIFLGGGRAIAPSPATHKATPLRAFRSIPTAATLRQPFASHPFYLGHNPI